MKHLFASIAAALTLVLAVAALPAGAQTLRGSNGASVGKIDSDGTVRGSNGASIGRAENVKRRWAAAFFFFDFF